MSGIYGNHVASHAIDGDLTTQAHCTCVINQMVWMRLDFKKEYCVETVRIVQSKITYYMARRMDGMEVIVTNGSAEEKCGDLTINDGKGN